MTTQNTKNKGFFYWISEKYRLVLMNDAAFREEGSVRLSPRNVIVSSALMLIVLTLVVLLLARLFAPSPKLPDIKDSNDLRTQLGIIYAQLDSLTEELAARDVYIEKIQALLNSNFEYEKDVKDKRDELAKTNPDAFAGGRDTIPSKNSAITSIMKTAEHEAELTNLVSTSFLEEIQVENLGFIPPVKGIISDTFAPARNHYGTDVVAPKGSVIKATQGGTVIVSTWSADTGHMLAIQHPNNVISFYKHNSSLLKRTGDYVNAGEAIAIIGNTGEMTDGPHLHFEIWYHGQPVNPQQYVQF